MSSNDTDKNSLPTDPRIIGPGAWFTIHTMAMSCEDLDSCLFFIQFVKAIVESFPCEKCRIHAIKFIDRNPPERYLHITNDIDEHIGMFKWSWKFHNFANEGLNKPSISFAEAWRLYSESTICSGDCDKDNQDPPEAGIINHLPTPSLNNHSEAHNQASYLVMKGSPNPSSAQITPVSKSQITRNTKFSSRR